MAFRKMSLVGAVLILAAAGPQAFGQFNKVKPPPVPTPKFPEVKRPTPEFPPPRPVKPRDEAIFPGRPQFPTIKHPKVDVKLPGRSSFDREEEAEKDPRMEKRLPPPWIQSGGSNRGAGSDREDRGRTEGGGFSPPSIKVPKIKVPRP